MKLLEIIVVLFLSILGIIIEMKWKKISWLKRIFGIVSIIGAIIIAYNTYYEWQKDNLVERINAKFGDIEDLHGATIPILVVGNSGTKFVLPKNGVLFADDDEPLFRIYVKDNKLFVNTIIRDKQTHPIAAIDDNTWTLFSNDYEYNNDETGFELVTKGDRMVYFQIHLENGEAHILGNTIGKNRYGVNYREINSSYSAIVMITPISPDEYFHNSAKTLFKYPRGKYIGVRAENKN